jgi:hypothetical protein
MAYSPEPLSGELTVEQLSEYLSRELTRISGEFQLVEDGISIPMRFRAPVRAREGMLAIADGTSWNPGSGRGLYEYRSGAWMKL